MNKIVVGLGYGCQHCDSSKLSGTAEIGGVRKVFRSLTGSSRRRLLEQQAARAGKIPEDLLRERKDRKQAWQLDKMRLKTIDVQIAVILAIIITGVRLRSQCS